MYAVKITYFTFSGRVYTTGYWKTEKEQLKLIWDEIEKGLRTKAIRPGFVGYTETFFHALIEVPNHKYDTPRLIPNIKRVYVKPKPKRKKPWIPPDI